MPARLSIHRPSPTTVSFTISDAPACLTWFARFAFSLQIALRTLIFVFVALVNVAKLRYTLSTQIPSITSERHNIWTGVVEPFICPVAERYNWFIIAGIGAILVYVVFRRGYNEESLLVIRGLGIQTSTASPMYWSAPTTRFIPTTLIQDIVIHEAFKGFEVRFYLAIIVEGEPNVMVVFPVRSGDPNLFPVSSTESFLEEYSAKACDSGNSLERNSKMLV